MSSGDFLNRTLQIFCELRMKMSENYRIQSLVADRMESYILFVISQLLDFLFPRTSSDVQPLDSAIFEGKQATTLVHRELTELGLHSIDSVTSARLYHESPALQEVIRRFKYGHRSSLGASLGNLMLRSPVAYDDTTVLCPVPLHWSRRMQRGFNQADVLARHLAQATGLPVRSLLRRIRRTGHQAWRGRADRLHALDNAFGYVGYDIPRHVILIDDLMTTGSTLNVCATVLKQRGVGTVDAWVIARA